MVGNSWILVCWSLLPVMVSQVALPQENVTVHSEATTVVSNEDKHCVRMCAACIHIQVCTCVQIIVLWSSFITLQFMSWDKVSHWTWSSPVRLCLLSSKLQRLFCLSVSPALGLQMGLVTNFLWCRCWGLNSGCTLIEQELYPAESSPQPTRKYFWLMWSHDFVGSYSELKSILV